VSTLAIIANPHAHRNRLWPLAAEALRKAAPGAPILETGTADDLRRAAQAVALARPRVLAIAGGDGTVQHTLTALHEALGADLPPLALLGGGALDSLASGLSGRGGAEDRLRRIAEALNAGAELHVEERDTLRASGKLGFRLGAGLPQRFLEALYAEGDPSKLRSVRLMLRGFASSAVRGPLARRLYEPLPFHSVSLDGEEWPRVPLFGLICASVAEGGLGLRPFRRAVEQPGFFQVLGLTGRPRQFAAELPRLLLGRPARRDRMLDGVAERLELRGQPFRWFLDGEMQSSEGSLLVTVGPRVSLVRA
jgi:diacylglycerol kinase family enzyme